MLGGITGVEGGSAAEGPPTGYNEKIAGQIGNPNLLGVLRKRSTAPGEAD